MLEIAFLQHMQITKPIANNYVEWMKLLIENLGGHQGLDAIRTKVAFILNNKVKDTYKF